MLKCEKITPVLLLILNSVLVKYQERLPYALTLVLLYNITVFVVLKVQNTINLLSYDNRVLILYPHKLKLLFNLKCSSYMQPAIVKVIP